jgi:hypothetical protein
MSRWWAVEETNTMKFKFNVSLGNSGYEHYTEETEWR